MRKALATLGFAALLSATPAAVPDAEADHRWLSVGAGFRIGGLSFSFVVGDAAPYYYWRTDHRLSYRGYSCTDACYFDRGAYYHHADCPLVHHHLGYHGYDPYAVFVHYAPPSRYHDHYAYRYYDRGYRVRHQDYGYRRYDRRHHRYDRRHDRYDHRHRYDHRRDRHRRHEADHHRYEDRRYRDDRRHDGDRDRRNRRDRRHIYPRDR